jgi:copper resistance protein C
VNGNGQKLRRVLAMLATLAVLAVVASGLIATMPAAAHDAVIDQSPARGETLAAGVIEIRLTFNNQLLAVSGASASEIIVVGPLGQSERLQNNSCAFLSESGRELSTRVDLDQPGVYAVSWRAVSSDGHPISQSFRFSVLNETGHVSSGLVPGTDCASAITAAEFAESLGSESAGLLDEISGAVAGYWLLWLALPLAAVAVFFLVRPRQSDKTQ